MKTIQSAGYDLTTPVIITNTSMYKSIEKTNSKQEKAGDHLMKLVAKD